MINTILNVLTQILKTTLSKIWVYITLIYAYISPLNVNILAIGSLITIDLILGLIAAIKNNEKISSSKLSQTAVKSLVYMLLLIAAFIINNTLVSYLPLVNICLAFLSVVEFTSIAENFQKITGLPFIKYLQENLQKYLKRHSDK